MVKYLRVINSNKLANLIYKIKKNHSFLEIYELADWMFVRINYGFMESHEFLKMNYLKRMSYKGIVKFPEHYETPNGILIDVKNKKFINLSDKFYEHCIKLEDIFPYLKKIKEFCAQCEFDCTNEHLDPNKIFPEFTNKEWNEFIKISLEIEALKETINVD